MKINCTLLLAMIVFSGHISTGQISVDPIKRKGIDTLFQPLEIIYEKRQAATELVDFGGSTTILTAKEIQRLPVTTLQEALQYLSGVDIRSRNMTAQGDVSIWGSTFEQVLILIDGIPMRDPQTGHHQLNLPVDLSQVQSIQVIKGAAARIYGAGALAGAINIITKDPGSTKASVQSFWGSNYEKDSISGQTYLSNQQIVQLGFRKGATGHSISLRRLHSNGYAYNTGVEQQGIFYRGNYRQKNQQWNWLGGYLNNQFGAKYFYAAPDDVNAIENVQTFFTGASAEIKQENITWTPRLYYRYNYDKYTFIAGRPEVYQNRHYSTSAGAELNGNTKNKWGFFGFGMESRADLIRSNNLGKHERFLHTAYLEQQFQPNPHYQITAGINTQISPSYKTKVFPSFSFLYKRQNGQFFIHSGAGSRLPSYTDLYYQDSKNIGNPNLSTEYGWTAETGVRYNTELVQFQLAYFYRRVNNQIDFTKGYDPLIDPNVWYPMNIGLSQFGGVECQIKGDLRETALFQNKMFALTQWGIRCNFLTTNMSNNEYVSKYVYNQINQQNIVYLGLKTGSHLTHQITYRSWQRADQAMVHVLDWRTSFQLNGWSIFADLSNITNEQYSFTGDVTMPGAWYQMGVQYTFPE